MLGSWRHQAPGARPGEGAEQTILTTAGTDQLQSVVKLYTATTTITSAQPPTLQSSLGWSHYSYSRQTLLDQSELLCDNGWYNITTTITPDTTHISYSLFFLPSMSSEHLPDTCSQVQDKIERFVKLCQFWLNIMRLSFSSRDYLILTQTSLWQCLVWQMITVILLILFSPLEMIITARYIL